MDDSTRNETLTLKSKDGDEIEISRSAAKLVGMIRNAGLEDLSEDEPLPDALKEQDASRVSTSALKHVVRFLEYYVHTPMQAIPDPYEHDIADTLEQNVPQEWYRNFVQDLGLQTMFEVRAAANYLEIQPLHYLTNIWLVFEMQGKSVEEIRNILRLPKLSKAEEKKYREEYPWAFYDFQGYLDSINTNSDNNQVPDVE
jgi:hypothetical protein